MNRLLIRIIASLIPSRKRRHAFRERHLKSSVNSATPATLEKRMHEIEAKLDLLVRFSFQKEIYPSLMQSWKVSFPCSEDVMSILSKHLYANSRAAGDIKRRFIEEQKNLLDALLLIFPYEKLLPAFRHLTSLCIKGDRQYNELVCLMATTLSWRAGNHLENLALMKEFFPPGTELSSSAFRLFIVSAQKSGNEELSRKLLKEYIEKFGTKDLWTSYSSARLAFDMGYHDEDIDFVYNFGSRLAKEDGAETLKNLLENKKVAVVGNGPQEIGSGNGGKIDSYDIVIRFNDFSNTPEHQKDYGTKTDFWIRNNWINVQDRTCSNIILGEFFQGIFRRPHLNVFKEIAKKSNVRLLPLPETIYHELYNEHGVLIPTSGAAVLLWLKRTLQDFSADDVYGFSFKAEIPPSTLEHYYKSSYLSWGSVHNLDKERTFLRRLFGLKGD